MDIKVEKARLEATLDALQLQKEADAAMAKADVLELLSLALQTKVESLISCLSKQPQNRK